MDAVNGQVSGSGRRQTRLAGWLMKSALILAVLMNGVVMAGETKVMNGVRRIAFVGDSLTDGSAWTDWVMETLQANGYSNLVKIDAGVAGDNVPKLKARFQHDVVDLKPDLVILNIGTNDREPVEEYRRDVREMVKQVRQTGARMVLCIPPGINDPKKPERDAGVVAYGEVLRELAKAYDCPLADFHAAFAGGTRAASAAEQTAVSAPNLTPDEIAKTSRILWGPDGVHHTINGWRTMGRVVLNALGCLAPMVEKVALDPRAVTDWVISPAIPQKDSNELPVLPENAGKGWRKFDRPTEIAQTSWWQRSWLERGGIMPLGQEVVAGKPGSGGKGVGAFALATVHSDTDTETVLHLGGAPGYGVWWNGELVWQCKALHGYHPDADRVVVKLRKGENQILVFSNWLFYVGLGKI